MWVRRVLVSLLLALFIFSIFGIVSARLIPVNRPPQNNEADPWAGGTEKAGGNSGATSSGIKTVITQTNSCSLIFIGNNILVVVFKVEVKNQIH